MKADVYVNDLMGEWAWIESPPEIRREVKKVLMELSAEAQLFSPEVIRSCKSNRPGRPRASVSLSPFHKRRKMLYASLFRLEPASYSYYASRCSINVAP